MDGVVVRPLAEHELPQWWEMRLRALKEHPDAFGSDYEASRKRGHGYLTDLYFNPAQPANILLVAAREDGSLLSTAGVYRETGKRSHIARVISVYTRPDARGHGLSRRVIDAAIAHCRSIPGLHQVHISVNADNTVALHVYESAGFVAWGREPRALALPGQFFDEIHLALMLDDESSQ